MDHRKKIAEDWCFVCKDGGYVRTCDYKHCIRSYHPACVGQEASFLDSKTRFVCSWHNCMCCGRCSALHCYTCPHSLCRQCITIGAKDFIQVKGVNGFCDTCLKLVLLVEGGMDYDSDEEIIDFADYESIERTFGDYYEIIKKVHGFELRDIYAAQYKKTKKDSDPGYSSEELYASEEDQVSDYDDYTESQKKRRKTQSGKKSIGQNLSKTPLKKVLRNGVSHTGFASIVVENIELVYLRRSLIYELVKERESFEEKVIGSFVQIKTDPYACTTTNSHQLMQVKGVKPASEGESNGEIVLLFPTMYGECRVSLLSDDNISEAECEDLKKKMVAGLLERPTVVELEQKAKVLHEVITEHWIIKELSLLKRRIERANEKGWRRELAKYLEERKKLQTLLERKRLLDTVPTVIPETISGTNHCSDDNNADSEGDEDSPKSGMLVVAEYREDRKKLQTPSERKRLLDAVPTVIPEAISEPNHSFDDKNADLEIDEDSPKIRR